MLLPKIIFQLQRNYNSDFMNQGPQWTFFYKFNQPFLGSIITINSPYTNRSSAQPQTLWGTSYSMDLHQLFVTLTQFILVQKGSEWKSLNTPPSSASHNGVHHIPSPMIPLLCPKSPTLLSCSLYKSCLTLLIILVTPSHFQFSSILWHEWELALKTTCSNANYPYIYTAGQHFIFRFFLA